ncbi:MAG TPA: YncE family protein [Terriglobales bacterium]|nr:YncE family protein [Terriglobales bacterium]
MRLSFRIDGTLWRVSRASALLALFLVCVSCGDIYRPVAIPTTPNPPSPKSSHYVLFLSVNGGNNVSSGGLNDPGASTRIDVSGDTNVGIAHLGLTPVHAALLPSGGTVYVANQMEDTISYYSPSAPSTVSTISLPTGSQPVFVASQENAHVYVANAGTNSVDVIATGNNIVTSFVPTGANPVAVVETPDAKKVYAVNQGDGTVTSINTLDDSVNPPISVGAAPVLAAVRSDSARLYVLNSGDGTVTAIDTATDAVLSTTPVGAGANFMFYDGTLNRLYVTAATANTLTVLSARSDPPQVLATVPMPASPLSVTALPDGSRAYVASDLVSGGTATSQVTVINTSDNSVKTTIPLLSVPSVCTGSTRFRLYAAASADSSRVYVSNCDAGSTAVISTVVNSAVDDPYPPDSLVLSIPAPVSALSSSSSTSVPPPQNPVFVLAGP